jgi:two-component system, chemotaxis family, sensor kinase Cph1
MTSHGDRHPAREERREQHICLYYETAAEQQAILTPYLKRGLEQGDCCIYVADERTVQAVVDELRAAGLKLDRLGEHGAMQVLTKYETFLRYARFEPHLMFEFLEKTARTAVRNGFRGVRISAEMSWALSTGCERLIEFETLVNDHLMTWNMTLLCQYNLTRFTPQILAEILKAHPFVQMDQRTCENVYYEPTDMLLRHDPDARRLRWMLDTVRRLDRRRLNGVESVT